MVQKVLTIEGLPSPVAQRHTLPLIWLMERGATPAKETREIGRFVGKGRDLRRITGRKTKCMAKLNITWPQFAVCNDNPTKAFENMCRRLFTAEFLKGKVRPHADHNNPGIEVLPILEPEREDG